MQSIYTGIKYDSVSNTYVINTLATASSVQAALNSAISGSVFSFEAGQYQFDKQLSITKNDISLIGAGQNETIFVFKHPINTSSSIDVTGKYSNWTGMLSKDVTQSDNSITLTNTSGLKAGDVLHIQQTNTTTWLNANGYSNIVGSSNAASNPTNETIVKIASVSGNVVTFETPVTHTMAAGITTVKLIVPVDNVKLEGFGITYNFGTPDPDLIADALPQYSGLIALNLNKTTDAYIHDVAVINAPSHNLEIRSSLTPTVDGFYGNGAFNKGATGNGYGIQLAETYGGSFDNLTLVNHRHAFVFSSWHTEVGNNVHILETNRDINYHGGPDYGNTVIVDRDLYRSADTIWRIVSPGGSEHPTTNIEANTTLFGVASAGSKQDVIYGWDQGAWLSGGAGSDKLYGGQGNDILLGGADYDTLTGGKGTDMFGFRAAGGRDTITDFQAGIGGDVIVLDGLGASKFSDIAMSVIVGGVRLATNGLSFADLLGVSMTSLKSENFLFGRADIFTPPVIAPVVKSVTGIEKNLTSFADNITGTDKTDSLTSWMFQLGPNDVVTLGQGQDKLIIKDSSLNIAMADYNISGLDVLDVSMANDRAFITLDRAFLESTDEKSLTIVYGNNPMAHIAFSDLTQSDVVITSQGGALTVKIAEVVIPVVIVPPTEPLPVNLPPVIPPVTEVVVIPPAVISPPPAQLPSPVVTSPVAGITLNMSSRTDILTGSAGTDTVNSFSAQITALDALTLKGGYDKLVMKSANYTFDATKMVHITGLDAIDMTITAGNGGVILDKRFLQQTDNGTFEIIHGSAGLKSLNVTGLNASEYTISRLGDKTLVSLSSTETVPVVQPTPTSPELIVLPSTPVVTPILPPVTASSNIKVTNEGLILSGGIKSGSDGSMLNVDVTNVTLTSKIQISGEGDIIFSRPASTVILSVALNENFHGTFVGSDGREKIYGNSNSEMLYGGGEIDRIYGGGGNDIIEGGKGRDLLYGGTGADIFIYNSVLDDYDRIMDFESSDKINLQKLFDENNLGAIDLPKAMTQGNLIIENISGNAKISFDSDGFSGSQKAVLILQVDDITKDMLIADQHILV